MGIPCFPIPNRQKAAKCHLCLERRLGTHQSQPIADAVHMNVHTDRWKIESHSYRQVRRLAPDPWQLAQLFHRLRKNAAEFLLQHLRQCLEMTRLVPEEAHRIDKLLNLRHGQTLQVLRTEQLPLCRREKPLHGPCRALVLRARRKDRADQHAERIMRLRLNQLDDWRIVRPEFLLERPVNSRYVLGGHRFICL